MSTIREQINQVKQQISNGAPSDQILLELVDVVDNISCAIDVLTINSTKINKKLDEIDEDLAEVENTIYDEDEEEDLQDYDCCSDEEEMLCPECGKTFELSESEIENIKNLGDQVQKIGCPSCGFEIEFNFDDDNDFNSSCSRDCGTCGGCCYTPESESKFNDNKESKNLEEHSE